MATQSRTNGELYDGPEPDHATADQWEDILNRSLSSLGWALNLTRHDPPPRSNFVRFTAEVSKAGEVLTLEIYPFRNLSWRNRGVDEKGIQLTRDYDEHAAHFQLGRNGNHRCLLLGVYNGANNEPVICAWDSSAYLGHANPNTCYTDVHAISNAYKIGFGRYLDRRNNRYACCFQPEFIHYYIANMDTLHLPPGVMEREEDAADPEGVTGAENLIFYGAPGTGKTHTVNELIVNKQFTRTVFHPDLQNGDFVGALKPVTRDGNVTYEFSPGPFAHAVKEAILRPNEEVFLVIEELNRAPAAAVFGDLFLLLDRDPTGLGRYDADFPTDEFKTWLSTNCGHEIRKLRLPANLWLVATMNSADQGVFPLDTAFRRRWKQEYINIDYANSPHGNFNVVRTDRSRVSISWADFAPILNDYLTEHLSIAEDRLLGPWFVSDVELASSDLVPGKILIYLWDDLLRHHGRDIIFNTGTVKTYGALSHRISSNEPVFAEGFLTALEAAFQEVASDA
ncbi:AAA family ATPase [Paracoccus sp. Ld10]|uniref:AAA family ATPase n=1 Tax=Paracoccus sp. Ld10 TaxID=649158 RepID=UPI003863BDA4